MKNKEVQKLKHGVYRLHWKSGGYSLATVGSLENGNRWFACANWVSGSDEGIAASGEDWKTVKKAVLIESRK